MMRSTVLACAALLLLLTASAPAPAAGFTATKTPPAVPADIKYIRCSVCQLMAKQIVSTYQDLKAEKGKHLKEEDIINAMERLTDPIQPEGAWISKLDLQEKGDELVPVEMQAVGECGRECKTIRKAAEEVLGDHDTDIAEKLFAGKLTPGKMQDWLCYKLSSACVKKAPPLPQDRAPGPEFSAMDEQAASVQSTLASMKAQGLGGEVFTRDEAMKKYMGMEDDEDLDDLDPDNMPADMRGMYDDLVKGQGKDIDKQGTSPASKQPTAAEKKAAAAKLLSQAQHALQHAKGFLSNMNPKDVSAHVQRLAKQVGPGFERIAKLAGAPIEKAAAAFKVIGVQLADKASIFLNGNVMKKEEAALGGPGVVESDEL